MSAFSKLADIGPLPIWGGVVARGIEGDRLTLAIVELSPGSLVPEHHHANEQIGIAQAPFSAQCPTGSGVPVPAILNPSSLGISTG